MNGRNRRGYAIIQHLPPGTGIMRLVSNFSTGYGSTFLEYNGGNISFRFNGILFPKIDYDQLRAFSGCLLMFPAWLRIILFGMLLLNI
jgi:hypothetical protein